MRVECKCSRTQCVHLHGLDDLPFNCVRGKLKKSADSSTDDRRNIQSNAANKYISEPLPQSQYPTGSCSYMVKILKWKPVEVSTIAFPEAALTSTIHFSTFIEADGRHQKKCAWDSDPSMEVSVEASTPSMEVVSFFRRSRLRASFHGNSEMFHGKPYVLPRNIPPSPWKLLARNHPAISFF